MAEGSETNGRDTAGRFTAGNPGGPGGARRRSCELRRAAEEAVTPEHIQAMVRKALRMGLEGNLAAMRLVFERTCGRAAEAPEDMEPLGIVVGRLRTVADCNVAIERLVDGITRGAVGGESAKLMIDALQLRMKAIEANELEERLAEMERTLANVDPSRRRN